jgi:hypothetical protein
MLAKARERRFAWVGFANPPPAVHKAFGRGATLLQDADPHDAQSSKALPWQERARRSTWKSAKPRHRRISIPKATLGRVTLAALLVASPVAFTCAVAKDLKAVSDETIGGSISRIGPLRR